MIQAIVFDFDGTLIDSNEIKLSAFYEVTAHISGAVAELDRIFQDPDRGDRYDIFAALQARLESDAANLTYAASGQERRGPVIRDSKPRSILRVAARGGDHDALEPADSSTIQNPPPSTPRPMRKPPSRYVAWPLVASTAPR